jgi:transcriptional regulator with GAF, ATPase, and Fis domain/Tfp pilus assembly protein PilF
VTAANVVDSGAGREGMPVLDARFGALRPLGRGASGETWVARDTALGDECVVKLFHSTSPTSPAARAFAADELRALTSLGHPSIVRVRDAGRTADGRPFLVTDLVAGAPIASLAAWPDDARRRQAFARAARELAGALAHLHGRGLVHGDVCPANVRLDATGRAVLLDFGLAGPPRAATGAASGTLGYAAPEALTGARTPAGDLFGLGATLFEAWTGATPFGVGLPAVQRMLTSRAPALSAVRPGLPEAWDRLVERLLAPEPRERPASARQVLRELLRADESGADAAADLGVPHPEGDPLDGIVVGRAAERGALRAVLERLAEGAGSRAAVAVVGAPGSGRRTLIEGVVRELAVAISAGVVPRVDVWRGDLAALEALAGVESGDNERDDDRRLQQRLARLADALERRAVASPLCVVLPEGPSAEALATFVAGAPPSGRLVLLLPARAALERPFAENVTLPPLGPADVGTLVSRAMAGEDVPPDALAALVQAAGGHAALVAVLARRLVEALRSGARAGLGGGGGAWDLAAPGADLDQVLARDLDALSPRARQLVVAATLAGEGAAALAGLSGPDARAAAAEARAAGWLGAELRPASEAHERAARAALAKPELEALAARAADALDEDDPRRPAALAAGGRRTDACAALRRLARGADDPARAAALLEEAAALEPGALDAREHAARASGLGAMGRYPEALAALDEAEARAVAADEGGGGGRASGRSRSPLGDERALIAERRAWLLARTGDARGAAARLRQALEAPDVSPQAAAPLRGRLARLLVSSGRFADALAAAEPLRALEDAPQATLALAGEATALAHAYLGGAAAARAALETPAGRAVSPGRRAYLDGLIAQLAGDGVAAREAYRRAYELSAAAGEVHTLATVALNLGALLAEQGVYGEALAATERAVRALGQLGATAELGTALVNAANLLVQLGDPAGARRALGRARDELARRADTLVEGLAAFVDGDLGRREGRAADAAASYAAATTRFLAAGQPHRAASAGLSRVEALALAGKPGDAARALDEALATPGAPARDPGDVELLQARLALALVGAPAGEPAGALAARAEEGARAAAARGHRPAAFRLVTAAARLLDRSGAPDDAARSASFARTLLQELRMATPDHHRSALDADPDARWLAGLGSAPANAAADVALAARAAHTEALLRRLLRINKRLNSEQRLPRLLETIVDTVIELCDAERGFLLLEDDSGELVVKVARNIDQKTLETEAFELSRSIAKQAAAGGEPIVTIDASGDARFKEAMSVSDLHLRSVLAVPLTIKGRAVGTIYADHRLRKGAFDDDDVKAVLDFAEQAAIAIENARLVAELRRRERQVEALNRRLEVELAARREELTGMKQELRENRESLAVRYDYRNIIGRTPRMLELFRLLDRLTDTVLPVVIHGESGTGKELVARAIHFNGPRKDQPFVSENCAAIPETLLESTLFGYVRGAFTGADRDARGLFEIADGGTLFLDEIGEMSPAMQSKLLRVLQEGELRRVGSERTRKIDVRIVAATNRDLGRMVEEGKFRQDLFFRLNVAHISLPPLRERRDDIPAIVQHFLKKPIEPAALARLCAHRWPGNVRELENELQRAQALSGERITVADLSPAVAAGGEGGAALAGDLDSLTMKPRVERLERSLIREALGRHDNNQTKAAEALGLSRFGLQKKLKRYRLA